MLIFSSHLKRYIDPARKSPRRLAPRVKQNPRMANGHPINRHDELLPWTWKAANPVNP
jgi:hypothetical protein